MKTIRNISGSCIIAALIAGMVSCELNEYNPSGNTADAVWNTPEGFQTLVNACYSNQRTWYGKVDGVFLSESGTDLWFNKSKDGYSRELSKYENFTPSTGNFNKSQWPLLYEAVNLCNAGVGRIGQAGFTSDEVRKQKEGEIRFLRAFYYFHIVETWGGVVLLTEETKEPILTAYRSPVEDFYTLMIEDLEFAVENLPVSHGDEYSRASKKSAMGLLARVYLTRAWYSQGEEANNYFIKARDIAKQIIDNQAELGVSLWISYADLWKPSNNKRNKEALYVISNSTNTTLNYDLNANRLHMWFMTTYHSKPGLQLTMEYGNDDGRRLMPTLFLLDLFNETMDSRYAGSFQEAWLCNNESKIPKWTQADVLKYGLNDTLIGKNKFEPGDTAMLVTKKSINDDGKRGYLVIDRDSVYHTTTDNTIDNGEDYVQLTKYMDPITRAAANSAPGYLDIIVIRLAEMYLIAAEAELQLGNPAEAASYINVLRSRAAIKKPVDYTAAMQVTANDVTLDFILDERARELCGEHFRWFDLKRTGKLVERVRKYNPDITQIQDYHLLRPVPQTEIDALLNGEEFEQNPGYH